MEVVVSEPERPGERPGIRPAWSRTDRPIPRLVLQPLDAFLQQETSGALTLIGAALVALVWANGPWSGSYTTVWSTHLSIRAGSAAIDLDLRHWVNDGLMSLFFLVAGLEIKRELTTGELRRPRQAALPVFAAVGGMAVPALTYLAMTGPAWGRGWGIAMPTDIALALGVLALAWPRTPPGVKAFLLALAIVDDLGSIVVIAVAYTGSVEWAAIAAATAIVLMFALLQRIGVRATAAYAVLGVALWVALERSGATPTLAGVAIGLLVPAKPIHRPAAVSAEAHRIADGTVDDPDPLDADASQWLRLAWLSREAVSPLARTERRLHAWTSLLVLPMFALANAGVSISPSAVGAAITSRIGVAVLVSRVVGKPLGIVAASALAVRVRIAQLPFGIRLRDVAAVGAAAGVPFAVSLFVAELGLPPSSIHAATIAILVAAVVAGGVGALLIRRTAR